MELFNLGTHLSFDKKNPEHIFDYAAKLQCKAFAFFTTSPQMGHKTMYTYDVINKFNTAYNAANAINPISKKNILIHAAYSINLSRYEIDDNHVNRFILQSKIAAALELPVVLHPGSTCIPKELPKDNRNDNFNKGMQNLCDTIINVYSTIEKPTPLYLENMANSWTTDVVGKRFEELRYILDRLTPTIGEDNIGICIDTAHLYTAGYDISSYKKMDDIYRQFISIVGHGKIKAFHLNDTLSKLGGGKDVHKRIGYGNLSNVIGFDNNVSGIATKKQLDNSCFAYIINHPDFRNIPMITETHIKDDDGIITELDLLRSLRTHIHG